MNGSVLTASWYSIEYSGAPQKCLIFKAYDTESLIVGIGNVTVREEML